MVLTSHRIAAPPDGVETWSGDVAGLVEDVRSLSQDDVWLLGGAKAA